MCDCSISFLHLVVIVVREQACIRLRRSKSAIQKPELYPAFSQRCAVLRYCSSGPERSYPGVS